MNWEVPYCKLFTGYRPCQPYKTCVECQELVPIGQRILIINLDALGHVLVTTSILPALKRKYPESHVSWITLKEAIPLLENNPYLDAVYEWGPESWLILQALEFDLVLNGDKAQKAAALAMSLKAQEKLGFGLNADGAIVPLNPEAEYVWRMGIDDQLKFRENRKTAQEILTEMFRLEYGRDRYVIHLTEEELAFCDEYKKGTGITEDDFVIGFNTGCSPFYPLKKMTIEQHVELIERIYGQLNGVKVVLLGGPGESQRNAEIKSKVGNRVISTPTELGIRKGLCFVNVCDLVVSGDTLGMHMAIGLGKWVVAWFGLSCPQEVDLYDRGVKIVSQVDCAPCWKRECESQICIWQLDLDEMFEAIKGIYHRERVYAGA